MADPADGGPAFNPSYVGLRPEIAERVPRSAARILDLGAADGTLGAFLLAARADRTVVGVESDEAMADVARHRLTAVLVGDLEALDWGEIAPNGPFDCVVAADVLEHLRDPDTVMRDAAALLAPGGTLVLSVPNIRHVSAFWSIYVRGTFPRRRRGLFDRTHLCWFTSGDAVRLCTDSGLVVRDVGFNHRFGDEPGGRANGLLARAQWVDRLPGIRQLLGYQTIITAERATAGSDEGH